jgi:hypothetical protein
VKNIDKDHGLRKETVSITIGEHFQEVALADRERILELLSDGELQVRSIKDYAQWHELEQACKDVIEAKKSVAFRGTRAACADIMDSVMQRTQRDHGCRVPKCWLPVIRKLRAEDGPVVVQPEVPGTPEPEEPSWTRLVNHKLVVLPEGVLRDKHSVLRDICCLDHKQFADVEDKFIAFAREHGTPDGYSTGIAWLDKFGGVYPNLASRLVSPRQRLVDMESYYGAPAK